MLPIVIPLSAPVGFARKYKATAWGTEGRIDLLDIYTMGSTRAVQPVEGGGRGAADRGIAPRMGSLRQSVTMRGVVGVRRSVVRSINITTTLRAVPNAARPGTCT